MRIVPYLEREYKSNRTSEELIEKLKKTISGADWAFEIEKINQYQISDGEISDYSFIVVKGRNALRFAKSSLLPIMKGILLHDKKAQKTIVRIVIRPFKKGVFGLAPFYCLVIYELIQSFIRGDLKLVLFCFLFLGVTYLALITKYNKEAGRYIELVEDLRIKKGGIFPLDLQMNNSF
jgi:hypothetical protein